MPYPSLLHPEPLSQWQSTADPYLHRRCSNAVLSQSLWASWCAQGLFEPTEHLWQVWDLILNEILPLLPSCWGFSFALGRGYLLKVSPAPHSRLSLLACPEDPRHTPKIIAYVNGVSFVISKEDFASGPGTRLDHSKAFLSQNFVKV